LCRSERRTIALTRTGGLYNELEAKIRRRKERRIAKPYPQLRNKVFSEPKSEAEINPFRRDRGVKDILSYQRLQGLKTG
jgi:hypothetical protein